MLIHILVRLFGNALTFYILDIFLKNIQITGGWQAYLLAGIILGIINISIKPVMKALTFPLKIITLGLFTLVINFIVLYLVALIINALALGNIHIILSGFKDYVLSAIVFTIINGIIHSLEKAV
jgi:putative membrane protein